MTSPISALLQHRLSTGAATPLITYYDDATGERTELSATTLANWVAKTANLLQDGLDVEAGQRIAVLLPPHWQTAAVLLGTWAVGAVVTEDQGGPVDVHVTDETRIGDLLDPEIEPSFTHLVGVALRPMGAPMRLRATGVTDFAAEVLVYGDDFVPDQPIDADREALVAGRLTLTAAGVVASATQLAARMGLVPGDRMLVDAALAAEAGPLAWLLAPLVAGASIVLCAHPDTAALAHRAATERVTVTLGLHVDGRRAAGG